MKTCQVRLSLVAACGLALTGCKEPIVIQPSCPAELQVGQTDTLLSNAQNTGEVARFLWEIFPSDAGQIEDPAASDTLVTGLKAGPAVARLTASDGLFQAISECDITIVEASEEGDGES